MEEARQDHGVPLLLLGLLELAVPGWIERLRNMSPADLDVRRAAALDFIAHQADVLMRRTKSGKAATGFNSIAEGLAVLAYQPGGVTWCGMHWEAEQGGRRANSKLRAE